MRLLPIAVLLCLLASPAPLPARSPEGSWSGFNAGLRGGWNFQPGDRKEAIAADTNGDRHFGDPIRTARGGNFFAPGFCGGQAGGPTPASGCGHDKSGVDWGVHIGYDQDLGSVVVGLLGEIGGGTGNDKVSAFSTIPASYVMYREQHYTFGLRARAGYAFGAGRNTLAYLTGGAVRSIILKDFRHTDPNLVFDLTSSGTNWAWGWRAGAGVDHRVHPHLSIGLLYTFTSLDDDHGAVRIRSGTAAPTDPFRAAGPDGIALRRTGHWFRSNSISVGGTAHF